jgi:hypothetical protein
MPGINLITLTSIFFHYLLRKLQTSMLVCKITEQDAKCPQILISFLVNTILGLLVLFDLFPPFENNFR